MDQVWAEVEAALGSEHSAADRVATVQSAMASVRDTIAAVAGPEAANSPAATFGAMVSTLESASADLLYPLFTAMSVVAKAVPAGVLASQSAVLFPMFQGALSAQAVTADAETYRAALVAGGVVASAAHMSALRSKAGTGMISAFTSALLTPTEIKVQGAALGALERLLKRAASAKARAALAARKDADEAAAARQEAADAAIVSSMVATALSATLSEASARRAAAAMAVLHCVPRLARYFPSPALKQVLEAVLGVLTLGHAKLSVMALRSLLNVVESPAVRLSVSLLGKLVSALTAVAPHWEDSAPAGTFPYLLGATVVRLAASETTAAGGDAADVTSAASGAALLQAGGMSALAEDGLPAWAPGRSVGILPRTTAVLAPTLKCVAEYFQSTRISVQASAANTMTSILLATLSPALLTAATAENAPGSDAAAGAGAVHSVIDTLRSLVSLRFQMAWPQALPVLGVAFALAGRLASPLLCPVLADVVALRQHLITSTGALLDGSEEQLSYEERDLETTSKATLSEAARLQRMVWRVLGQALRAMGPQAFLREVPLSSASTELASPNSGALAALGAAGAMSGVPSAEAHAVIATASAQGVLPGVSDDRTWLLRLLKEHMKYTPTPLTFWLNHLLPAARQCEAAAGAAAASNMAGSAKTFRMRGAALWALLPAVCTAPPDVEATFNSNLGKLLTRALNDLKYPGLVRVIAAALEVLIARHREAAGLEPHIRPGYAGPAGGAADGAASTWGGGTFGAGSRLTSIAGSVSGGSIFRGGGVSVFGGAGGQLADEDADIAADTLGERVGRGAGTVLGSGDRHPAIVAAMGVGGRLPKISPEAAAAAVAQFSRMAPAYLPALFNTYEVAVVAGSTGRVASLLNAVSAWMAVAPEQVIANFSQKLVQLCSGALGQIQQLMQQVAGELASESGAAVAPTSAAARRRTISVASERPDFRKAQRQLAAFLSLALTLIPRMPAAAANAVLQTISSLLATPELTSLQKRAFAVLHSVCSHHSALLSDEAFLSSALKHVHEALGNGVAGVRKACLRCLEAILAHVQWRPELQTVLVARILGDVLLCIRDGNKRTRAAALDVVVTIAMRSCDAAAQAAKAAASAPEEAEAAGAAAANQALREVLQLFAGGMTGSTVALVSATILALARLTFEFNEAPVVHELAGNITRLVLLAMRADSVAIARAVYVYLKTLVTAVPPEVVRPMLPDIVTTLMAPSKSKKKLRRGLRVMLERLSRKFGADEVAALVPASDEKLLKHMQRMRARAERRKSGGAGGSDSDSSDSDGNEGKPDTFDALLESDDEGWDPDAATAVSGATSWTGVTRTLPPVSSVVKGGRRGAGSADIASGTWLRADQDEPLDLLDPTSARAVTHTAPESTAKSQKVAMAAAAARGGDLGDGISIAPDGRIVVRELSSDEDGMSDSSDDEGKAKAQEKPKEERFERGGANAGTQGWDISKRAQLAVAARQRAAKAAGAGNEYASKRGRGDAQRKGQDLAPYAFLPLDPRAMSGKHGAKAVSQFSGVTKTTMKRGAGKRARAVAASERRAGTKRTR